MKIKMKLLCFSVLSLGLFTGSLNCDVNASTILPSEKPELIINEQSDMSGDFNSHSENKKQTINVGGVEIEKPDSSSNNGLGFMTPEEILGNKEVTIETFGNTIISRLLDVVSFFQKFAKPFAIIMFILSALLSLISLVFGTNKVKTGLLGMMLSVIAYVAILYAPNMVLFFAQWLSV